MAAAVALGLWEAWVRARDIKEYLVPAPTAVAEALLDDPSRFVGAGIVSLEHALGGSPSAGARRSCWPWGWRTRGRWSARSIRWRSS